MELRIPHVSLVHMGYARKAKQSKAGNGLTRDGISFCETLSTPFDFKWKSQSFLPPEIDAPMGRCLPGARVSREGCSLDRSASPLRLCLRLILPLLESPTEKLFKEEQKLSKAETRGWEYISEREAAGTNRAPTDNVPSRGAENGMLEAMVAVGMAPRTTAFG